MTRSIAANIRGLTLAIALAFLVTSFGVGYWTLVSGEELNADPYNPRLVAAIRDRPRGFIKDAAGNMLAQSAQTNNGYKRIYTDKTLAHVTGYASFQFGDSRFGDFSRFRFGDPSLMFSFFASQLSLTALNIQQD